MFPGATQKSVATRAEVSQTTVSHILGGKGDIYSKETQRQVMQAAEELNYRPNHAARAMRRGKSDTIVHLNYGGYSELAGKKAYHLGRFVHEAGFDYQVIDSYWWPEKGPRIIDRILSYRPEGVIVSGTVQTEIDFNSLRAAEIPVVAIDAKAPGCPRVDKDVRSAVAELTRQCLAQGRRPAILLRQTWENPVYWTVAARKEGFLDALREAGFDHIPERKAGEGRLADFPAVIWDVRERVPFTPFEGSESAARWLIEEDCLPDALVCSNDFYALGVMGELALAGIRVPEDIAIAGFDNLSYAARRAVSLTTVEQPLEAMCAEAVALLKEQIITGPPYPKKSGIKKILPCRIHWRRSLPRETVAVPA